MANEESGARVTALFDQLREGRLALAEEAGGGGLDWRRWLPPLAFLGRVPVVVALILVCLLFYPLTIGYEEQRFSALLHLFTFTDFQTRGVYALFGTLGDTLGRGELWRLWTPVFIHFGMLHLVFNLLFVWVCGSRIEIMHGSRALLLVTLVAGLLSNGAQYWMSGAGLFGGMSGVVYAYLGYCFVWSRLRPERSFGLPNGIYIFMLVWLALGFAGLFDLFLSGSMANGAHLGGLLAGLCLGAAAHLVGPRG